MIRTSSTTHVSLLLLCVLPCMTAAELTVESSLPVPPSHIAAVRGLIKTNRIETAISEIRSGLGESPGDSRLQSLLGEALFRQADFTGAEDAYAAALRTDARNARASWGLGRIASLRSRSAEAAKRFATAFQLDPRDPDIILSYAGCMQDAAARATLLRNFLRLSDPNDIVRREHAAAQLEVADRLGQRRTRITSGAAAYHFPLTRFIRSADKTQGLLLTARINGGKPLRLLLDSGAEGIYLNSRAASKLDLELLAEARIAGLGQKAAIDGQVALARTVTLEQFQMENSILHVMDLAWLPDADGVIGTEVFKDFLVRIDAPRHTLDLLPLEDQPSRGITTIPAYRVGHYLLVQGSANDRAQGYFMVDTGASSTVVAPRAASSVLPSGFGQEVSLRDARGPIRGATLAPVSLKVAGRQWWDTQAVTLDLADLSRQTGVEILGVLGFPLLRQAAVVINYRDGLIEFEQKR